MASICSLSSLTVLKHFIPAYKGIPNTSIQNKPLLLYKGVFQGSSASASNIERHLSSVGVVTPQWRYTMYSTTHFHSTCHEVLSVTSGSAKCCFGHEDNPDRVELKLEKGDVVIVPAGVGHRLIDDYATGFQMVGAYPKGKSWDMCYGEGKEAEEKDKVQVIKGLGWFERDPVFGDQGPVLDV